MPGIGYLSNGGTQRYLIEAESTTGFIAWKLADGTVLISTAKEISIKPSPFLSFWPCAGQTDSAQDGEITFFDTVIPWGWKKRAGYFGFPCHTVGDE